MENFIYYVFFVALMAAFIDLFMAKTGIKEYLQVHAPRKISEMIGCGFCLSFWTGVIISIILTIIFGRFVFIFIPILSTPLTRLMI